MLGVIGMLPLLHVRVHVPLAQAAAPLQLFVKSGNRIPMVSLQPASSRVSPQHAVLTSLRCLNGPQRHGIAVLNLTLFGVGVGVWLVKAQDFAPWHMGLLPMVDLGLIAVFLGVSICGWYVVMFRVPIAWLTCAWICSFLPKATSPQEGKEALLLQTQGSLQYLPPPVHSQQSHPGFAGVYVVPSISQ
jgi:hypothetical protein